MFTTEPPLTQRIDRLIAETPVVDPHTHLHCDRPAASDLASLMSYHWIQTELRSVGMAQSDFDTALPVEERVRRAIPYLKRMRNTAMSWCFYRILRDLYDFHDPDITEANLSGLLDQVAATGREPTWPRSVLRDRCNIRTVVTSLGNRGEESADLTDSVYFMLDAHYLFCPGVATDLTPFFEGRHTKTEYIDALAALFDGQRPSGARQLEHQLFDWLDRTVSDRVRFTNTFLPIEARFHPPDESKVDGLLASRSGTISGDDLDALISYVSWKVLEWHHEHRKAFQIAVGAEYFICDGKSIPRHQETWISEMARAFHRFSGARFDLMTAHESFGQEAAVLARQFPNVYTSGYWWHTFFPVLIERAISLRTQITPMSKFGGFLCDAYYVEWTYGKLQVIKRAMSASLARLVEQGFLEEDSLPELLHQTLHDTPRQLYDIGD